MEVGARYVYESKQGKLIEELVDRFWSIKKDAAKEIIG